MNNRELHPIIVTGEDAEIVSRYHILTDAKKREDAAKNTPLINPIVEYQTEEEKAILHQYFEVLEKHRRENNLIGYPQLIPIPPQPAWQPAHPYQQRPFFYECRHSEPTDLEQARLFIHRQHVRTRNGSVYLYNGKYYKKLSDDQLKSKILSILRDELEIKGNSKQLDTVAAAIKAEPTIQVNDEKLPVGGLCLENCVIDIASMTCADHDPRFFFTIKLDVQYQGPQPTPVMDRFLCQIAGGDPVLIRRIWQVIGYCLVPQDNRAKRFFLLQGLGNTGKSVLGSVIASFYEETAVGSVDAFHIGDRFSLSSLINKAINLSMDLPSSALNDQAVGVIKQIVGNDLVQVEEKYRTPYAARVGTRLIFGTNHQLRTNTFDAAFLRRICLIPFNYPVPKHQQDTYLLNKLKLEKSGIFWKAMEAYRELVANNYTFAGDDVYDMVNTKQAGEQLIDHDACIEAFIERHIAALPGGFVPTEELHTLYLSENPNGLTNRQKFSSHFKLIAAKKGLAAISDKQRYNGKPANGYKDMALM